MKILMISRSTLYTSPGGDTTQIISTAKALRKLNVAVDVKLTNEEIDYSCYDLLHFFNIIRPSDILSHIRKSKKPYVLSTIFVDYSEYEKHYSSAIRRLIIKWLGSDFLEYFKTIARFLKNDEKIQSIEYLLFGHKKAVKTIIKKSELLLPNSESEFKRLFERYRINSQYIVVPNAIDKDIFKLNTVKNTKFNDSVICVGRIEGVKNQLKLIEAINDTSYKLFIIGKPSINSVSYYNECKKSANKNIEFIEHLSQYELASIYSSARVHVLPSWFETTGLVSLEAAAMGCNIVVTKKGDQQEYFKDIAEFCNPDDAQSIKKAIDLAYSKTSNDNARTIIQDNYTWEHAASKTLEAYNRVVSNKPT